MQFKAIAILGLTPLLAVAQAPPATRIVVVDRIGPRVIPETAGAARDRGERAANERLVAANEAAAIDACLSYVEAQFAYFREVHRDDGYLAFASRIRSSSGKHDGLFWPIDATGDESPVGPRFASAAATEDQAAGSRQPYSGYYFKILLAQGDEAPGGARDYRIDGRLLGGFALLAWPAEYGVTGIRSFIVNHLGGVFAQDLGAETPVAALSVSVFSPDKNWSKISSADRMEGSR